LNYKQVVTSFLTADQRILLLHRSGKVGSYRGKWSAVSGYLEGAEEPLTRAVTEIREELGLSAEQVNLIRAGEVLRAYDEDNDTVWIINPFLFQTKSEAIKLDWENTEYRWIDPADLPAYDTVPKLKETFDRVRHDLQKTPESLAVVMQQIKEMESDRDHGATFLGRRAMLTLLNMQGIPTVRSLSSELLQIPYPLSWHR
jgi:8-oxo-dGTP pyrophosphatase MutT (NUDIX family)